jgi:NAD(P)-dependent dehydrogenase (short-subunit alcohol dehydrogenase family)
MTEAAAAAHGGPDILVNNAAVRYFDTVENFAPERWDEA